MLPNRFTEPDFPRQASDVKWRKTTEEGESRKRDRTRKRRNCGRDDGDTEEEHHETQGKNEPVTKLFIKTTSVFLFLTLVSL